MVGLLGYAVAGAAQGAGESIAAQALARREAALEEVRAGRVTAAEIRRQKFQTSEREAAQNFTLKRDQLKAQATGTADPEYGLNPQYGVDKDGNPVLLQLGKDGTSVQTPLPEGVTLSKTPIKLDAGTHYILLDPITRQPVGQVEKDIAGAEAAKVEGKQLGEAQTGLGGAVAKADESIKLIDELMAHDGRETATGLSSVLDPRNYLAGTDASDFNVRRKQLAGRAFLEAFESLKGGGHITEIEGQKATEAMARLDTNQSDEAFLQSMRDLKAVLDAGKKRAYSKAGVEPPKATVPDSGGNKTSSGVKWSID